MHEVQHVPGCEGIMVTAHSSTVKTAVFSTVLAAQCCQRSSQTHRCCTTSVECLEIANTNISVVTKRCVTQVLMIIKQ